MFIEKNSCRLKYLPLLLLLFCSSYLIPPAYAATIEQSGIISEHTTWTSADVHLITSDVTVNPGIVLTIAPGTVVKFNAGRRLHINGAINAVGAGSNRITFTSYRDDSAGGDTNGNGPDFGQPGDWGSIRFGDSVTESLTQFENVDVRYGGSDNTGNIYVYRADIDVLNNTISRSSSYGLRIYEASPTVTGNTISDNNDTGIFIQRSRYGVSASPLISNNTLSDNARHGLYSEWATPSVDNNQIINNGEWGIYHTNGVGAPVISGNTVTGNRYSARLPATAIPNSTDNNTLLPNLIDGLWIIGTNRTEDLRLEVLNNGDATLQSYRVEGSLVMNNGTTLTVEPGVIVKFTGNSELTVHGKLNAVGTTDNKIVFTSYLDDAHGGDFNEDGYGSSPGNGNWRGIYLSNQADDSSVIEHAVIQYGGANNSGNVYTDQTDVRIANSVISNSSSNGIRSYQSSPVLENLQVYANSSNGLYLHTSGNPTITGSRIFANFGDGVDVRDSVSANISGNEIFGNVENGVRNTSSNAVDATDVWWGAADGPGGDQSGSGDEVVGNVTVSDLFNGFRTNGSGFSYFNAGPNLSEGNIAGPAVVQGSSTDEWGSSATQYMLFDLNRVILDYVAIDNSKRYDLFVTYYNPDNTNAIGGTIQTLTDASEQRIHNDLIIPRSNPSQYDYRLSSSSYASGDLRLNFNKENGYRATVSQVWLVERAASTDSTAPATVINAPSVGARLGGGLVTIAGTVRDTGIGGVATVEVGIHDGSSTQWYPVSQLTGNGNWHYRWTLPTDGNYTIYSRARDRIGNVEALSTGVAVIVDQTAPSKANDVSAFDTPADAGNSINVNWALSNDDGNGANDVANYRIERRDAGASDDAFTEVGNVSASINTFSDTSAITDAQYAYRIITVDLAGNRSTSMTYAPAIALDNSIADTTAPEDVTNLIGRPGNEHVYLSWTSSVDSNLDLVSQQLDISADGGANWGVVGPAYTDGGSIGLSKTINHYLVNGLTNGTGYRFRIRAQDSANPANISSGTQTDIISPSATAFATVSGTLSQDTVWAAGVFYVSNNVSVAPGVSLTIQPGVIVKFASGRNLFIDGSLSVLGQDANPVTFTAFTDDSAGGDTNGDGASTGAPGYWGRIQFNDAANDASFIDHAVVRYGGSGNDGSVYIFRCNARLSNSEVSHSGSYGVRIYESSPVIDGNTIADNGLSGILNDRYRYGASSRPVFRNNTVTRNGGSGLVVNWASPAVVDNNIITGNTDWGIYTNASVGMGIISNNTITGNRVSVRLPFSRLPNSSDGNTLSPNTHNRVEFWGDGLSRVLTLGLSGIDQYYQVGNNAVVSTGALLTIPPGTIWKFGSGTGLTIDGALNAVGNSGNRITFTSYRDDSVGGDTNGDGNSAGQADDWGRIQINDTAIDFLTRIENTDIRYGGRGSSGSLYVYRADIDVLNNTISRSSSYGLRIYEASPTVTGNTISDNNDTGIFIQRSRYGVSASPLISNNTLSDNARHGLYSEWATPSVDNNQIINNGEWGIYHTNGVGAPVISGNTVTGNRYSARLPATAIPNSTDNNTLLPNLIDGLWIIGTNRTEDLRLEVLNNGDATLQSYRVEGSLVMNNGTTLTVEPGVIVKFTGNSELTVHGKLNAVGTTDNKIVFTSYLDDAHGGDFNEDGYGSSPGNGNWRGIYLSNQADDSSVIEHAVIQYGGANNSGNVYTDQTDVRIANSVISNSSSNGIRSYRSSPVLENLQVYANSQNGLYLHTSGNPTVTDSRIFANFGDGVDVRDSVSANVSGNEIFGNVENGVRNTSSNAVDATDVWWGAADGPGGDQSGSGDEVVGNVTVSDFRTDGSEFNYYNAGGSDHYGYGIITPDVSGTPSTEWGSSAINSILYDFDNQRITAEYTGLSASSNYLLLVTYFTNETGGTKQTLTTGNGDVIHQELALPSTPRPFAYVIPKSSIISGGLTLNFDAIAAPRAVVSTMTLIQQPGIDTTSPSVSIDSPANGAILPADVHQISGSAIDAESGIHSVEVGIQKNSGTTIWSPATTLLNNGNWTYLWNNPQSGNYSIVARAFDQSGNSADAPALINVVVDTDPPATVTGVIAENVSDAIRVIWITSADDGTGKNDVVRYEVFRSNSSIDGFALIGSVVSGVTQLDDNSVVIGTDYYFYVRTIDSAGNSTDSSIIGPVTVSADADTTAPEDVSNFAAAANQVNGTDISTFLTWTPGANTASDLVSQRLYVSIDGGTTYGSNAPAFDNGNFIDLGRKANRYQVTGLQAGTTYTFKLTTVDEVPNESSGVTVSLTPTGAANEVASLSGTITENLTLGNGIFVITGNLTLSQGTTLTLNPGTIIKLQSSRNIDIYGSLYVNGGNGDPVVFTSYTDDAYGGDTNGDGSSSGSAGYWGRVTFYDEANDNSYIDNAVIRYGGRNGNGNLYIFRSDVNISNTVVSNSSSYGLRIYESSPEVINNTIIDNASSGIFNDRYRYGKTSSPVIQGNTISRNGASGLAINWSTPMLIDGNIITDNADWGIYTNTDLNIPTITNNTITGNNVSVILPARSLPDSSNVLTPNTRKYIGIRGGNIIDNKQFRIWAKGTVDEVRTYVIYTGNVFVPRFKALTIDPGVIVKFEDGREISVDGALIAAGIVDQKVIFTSLHDDTYSGDTNANGGDTIPTTGSWRGIRFNDSLLENVSIISHAVVRYSGANGSGAIYTNRANVTIESTEISSSSTNGIRIYEASPTITGNRIWGNVGDGVRVERNGSNPEITFNIISTNLSDGIEILNSATAIATNNQIFMNRGMGLRNTTNNVVDATQTWWGDSDATGPLHATTNPTGTGNEVSSDVTYDPYRTTVVTEFGYKNFSASTGSTYGVMVEPTLIQGALSDEWDTASLRSDRTMAWDANTIIVDYTNLTPGKRYKVRVSYFNGDPAVVLQSLTDGGDNPIHGSIRMPTTPTQYEFSIPPSYYASGNIRLRFVHDNPSTSLRAAIPEIWIIEDVLELTPPRFDQVDFNDIDGNGVPSLGDEYYFRFSEAMDTSLLVNGSTDANARLVVDGAAIYGNTNQSRWSADETTVIVTLTDGFTVTGSETVTPTGLADKFGNAAVGSQRLDTVDVIAPVFTSLDWLDNDNTGNLTLGDAYRFNFNETMNASILNDGSSDANSHLRPAGGGRYGDINSVIWAADAKSVTVIVTEGFNILGDEQVVPSSFVRDAAANSVIGTQVLTGRDLTAPHISNIEFDDADASGTVTVGDRYIFSFNEIMNPAALSNNTVEANENLSPEGQRYGSVNIISWNPDNTQVTVHITAGFTVNGSEIVDPSDLLTDIANNTVDNTFALTLLDTIAPKVLSANGSIASPVPVTNNYRITVQFNSAMDSAVDPIIDITGSLGSVPTVNSGGIWSSTVFNNDTYTTPPINLTQDMKGNLGVNISSASDTYEHTQVEATDVYSFALQADSPVITSHPVAPAVNNVNDINITLEGNRNGNTSIWVGNSEIVAQGAGVWSAPITIGQGATDIVVYARDEFDNVSAPVTVKFFVDSVAPVITGITPANNTFTRVIPTNIVAGFVETGVGLDIAGSTLLVTRNAATVSGSWTATVNTLIFSPFSALVEGDYSVAVQLRDNGGLQSTILNATFTVDQTAPADPVLDTIPATTSINNHTVTGTTESYSAIWLNGTKVVDNTVDTTWSYTVALTDGLNTLRFVAEDRAGNGSNIVEVTITFDNTAPGPVIPTATAANNGTAAMLDWATYDEAANGNDIANYTVYISTSAFSDVASATAIATISAGTQSYTAEGLVRGQTYFFAIMATDTLNNAVTSVTSISVTLADTVPPAEISNLNISSTINTLSLTWSHSSNTEGDLANYKVYFNGDGGTLIAPTTNTHSLTGLTAATGYPVRITAVDNDGNESAGVQASGVTLLPNPVSLSVEPFSGLVELTWSAASPASLVGQYAIYASSTPFTDVTNMTPNLRVARNLLTTRLAGLTNGTTYYFAVTTINLSGSETKVVSTVSATPQADQTGPTIDTVTFEGATLVDGISITQPGSIALTASDPSGISRTEFLIDGVSHSIDTNGSDGYSAHWDIKTTTDGAHTISAVVYDTLDNSTQIDRTVIMALAAPAVPVVIKPAPGLLTNNLTVSVEVSAEPDTSVLVYNNNTQIADPIVVPSTGLITLDVTLADGDNALQAAAQNRGGLSPLSTAVVVTLDRTLPNAPFNLTANVGEGGIVQLNWLQPNDQSVIGYNVYRATSQITDIASASKLNTNVLTGNNYSDIPATDGTYYYAAVAVNGLGTESDPSNTATANVDSTAPKALAIDYLPTGPVDEATGRMGVGLVNVNVLVDEPLLTTPFLSIAPHQGVPVSVELSRVSDTQYRGSFDITDRTNAGIAYAVFSARDLTGNRGTEIVEGQSINIDTAGPEVVNVVTTPQDPMRNDTLSPATVGITITLDQPVKPGEMPTLGYILSAAGRTETAIAIVQDSELVYRGTFMLPNDAGLAEVENMQFTFSAIDDLGNISTRIQGRNQYQVYQGDLPPLATPFGLTATALKGGQIQLSWNDLQDVEEYEVHRQAPGETALTVYTRVSAPAEFTDSTVQDGLYKYAVASVRKENGQDAVSTLSNEVEVTADSVAPDAPTDLTLALVGAGIQALWQAPAGASSDFTYSVYRSSGTLIISIDGLTPIQTNIGPNSEGILGYIDPNPSSDESAYVVTAVDNAGNESLASNTGYLNVDLLPVNTLSVVQEDISSPVVNWSHKASNLNGFDIYLGSKETGIKLNSALLTETAYTDTGYTNKERTYTVVAVDAGNAESVGRTLTLPMLSATMVEGTIINRGAMNAVSYDVNNSSAIEVVNISLKLKVDKYESRSSNFSLAAGETKRIIVVVGGHADIPVLSDLKTSIEITPNAGETISIIRNSQIEVGDAGYVVNILPEELTRGGTGQVRITVENTSKVDIEIVTATSFGNVSSDEIRFKILDLDDNILSTQGFKQSLGAGVIALNNGKTVARIQPGEVFTSDPFELGVPVASPDEVTIQVQIDKLHYRLGKPDHVVISGINNNRDITLVDTPYTCEVDSIAPLNSFGDQDIVITGRTIDRLSTVPLATAPVKLIMAFNGFEKVKNITTDDAGHFSYSYTPQSGESGVFKVSCIHPDLQYRPDHGQFAISRIITSPAWFNLRIPHNVDYNVPIQIQAGEGTVANNVRLEYRESDQTGSVFTPGIQVSLLDPIALNSNQRATLNIAVRSDGTAPESGSFIVSVLSDETGIDPISQVEVRYQFSEAVPALSFAPNFVETGVAHNDAISESVTLENKGLADMTDVTLTLLNDDGTPAPSWVYLTSPENQGTIAVGDKRRIDITFAPSNTIFEGVYPFILRVTSSNHPARDINIFASVSLSGIGNALFKISDIYTATLDAGGNLIPGLSGATIRVQNEQVQTIERVVTSDEFGEVFMNGLPAGSYRFRASAANHLDISGRIRIKPGITAIKEVFLDYSLVTVEWSITEISIEDRYEITLSATYELDLPTAVVAMEPRSINLPIMAAGDVFYGEVTLTNLGLIRADDVVFSLPASDEYFQYEIMTANIPDTLEPKQVVSIPYRVVALKALDPDADGSASGAGCYNYSTCMGSEYNSTCANGVVVDGSARSCFYQSGGSCGGGSGGGGGGGGGGFGGGFGGGGSGGPVSSSGDSGLPACRPDAGDRQCGGSGNGGGGG
ncbi:MAG: right-handed parallel beta-helix repeat-containing protein [Gammaproteobacteria bacterium]|nr:right-handed parallel beta-helix repeat-containing protein [Gammaproteobacteria bacterium]